jgi:tetratricopeptide (TPR) repeat protein
MRNSASILLAITLTLVLGTSNSHPQDQRSDEQRWKGAGGKALAEGRPLDAEKIWKSALKLTETFGADDGRLIITLNNLADLYQRQGEYAEAETHHKRALVMMEKRLGPEHPLVAQSLNNLAKLYWLQGRPAEAEPLVKRLLAIVEKIAGADHPNVAQILSNLAELHKAQNRYADAEAPISARWEFERTL